MAKLDASVQGFRDLNRKLKAIEPNLQKELAKELKGVAETIAEDVRGKMPVRTGAARSSVRAGATQSMAYVAEGKSAVPYVGWLDFGGKLKPTGKRRGLQSRPIIRRGRYLYPTIVSSRPRTLRAARQAMDNAARKAGFR